jgi:hypothetical protein
MAAARGERPTPAAVHPSIVGREAEMARLVAVVRRLVELTVTNQAAAAELERVAEDLELVTDRFAAHATDGAPVITWMDSAGLDGRVPEEMADRMAFDVVIGRYSPLALPVVLAFEPPRAIGRATFTAPYEGPPGCIHGAVIAATFDIVLTAANILVDAAGPTVRLATRFRRPTLLYEEAVFEAWVDRREGDRTFTKGRLVQRGVVTVEAEGTFAAIDRRRIGQLARSQSDPRPDGAQGERHL